jgi:crossover junction endodeoxyribonuclease RusA
MLLTLPFPPSVNTYWRSVGGRVLLSKKGREFKKQVENERWKWQGLGLPWSGRLSCTIELYRHTKHKYDIDNYVKAILDSLQNAGFIENDEQVDQLTVTRLTGWGNSSFARVYLTQLGT